MKRILISALCILAFAGLKAQEAKQFEHSTNPQEVKGPKEALSSQSKDNKWYNPTFDLLETFYQGAANNKRTVFTMWPDSTVQAVYDGGASHIGTHSGAVVIDPYAPWYSQTIDSNKATGISIDSLSLLGFYHNVNGTFEDTLVLEISTGVPNKEPAFLGVYIPPSANPDQNDTLWFSTPKLKGNSTQFGWEAKLTDPNKHVVKHVLTPDDSTASMNYGKIIKVATGGINVAPGEVITVNATYVPGFEPGFADTIADFTNDTIYKNTMQLMVGDLNDDASNDFVDPYNDVGHYNGTYFTTPSDRYSLADDAWRNEIMTLTTNYGAYMGAYIDWTVDVEENQNNMEMSIHPNPVSDHINISVEDYKNASLEVYNLLGEVVKSENINSQNTRVNVSGLNNGTYIVRVLNEDKTATQKVVVQ